MIIYAMYAMRFKETRHVSNHRALAALRSAALRSAALRGAALRSTVLRSAALRSAALRSTTLGLLAAAKLGGLHLKRRAAASATGRNR